MMKYYKPGNDRFDVPYDADLYINTSENSIQQSTSLLVYFILNNLYATEKISNKMTDNF